MRDAIWTEVHEVLGIGLVFNACSFSFGSLCFGQAAPLAITFPSYMFPHSLAYHSLSNSLRDQGMILVRLPGGMERSPSLDEGNNTVRKVWK